MSLSFLAESMVYFQSAPINPIAPRAKRFDMDVKRPLWLPSAGLYRTDAKWALSEAQGTSVCNRQRACCYLWRAVAHTASLLSEQKGVTLMASVQFDHAYKR